MLAGIGALHSLAIRLELLPSGRWMRLVLRFWMWPAVWLGVSASLQFGCGLPGCIPGGVGVGGPLLVPGIVGFEALAFGGQLRGEGRGAGRAGMIVLSFGICRLLEGVGFGLRGEAQGPADVGRCAGLGAFTDEDPGFELATV